MPSYQTLSAITKRDNLATAGWGVIYPDSEKDNLLDALRPLLNLRNQQAGSLYQEIPYRNGQSLADILEEKGAPAFGAEPIDIPYYLLIIGKPQQNPIFSPVRVGPTIRCRPFSI